MRFINTKVYPHRGDKRTVTKFAFLPIRIGRETRWLTTVTLDQEYVCEGAADYIFTDWVNQRFVDRISNVS